MLHTLFCLFTAQSTMVMLARFTVLNEDFTQEYNDLENPETVLFVKRVTSEVRIALLVLTALLRLGFYQQSLLKVLFLLLFSVQEGIGWLRVQSGEAEVRHFWTLTVFLVSDVSPVLSLHQFPEFNITIPLPFVCHAVPGVWWWRRRRRWWSSRPRLRGLRRATTSRRTSTPQRRTA